MEVLYPRCAGLDVHQQTVVACVRLADGAKVEGVLHALDGATTVVTLMHPRQSVTHHPMIPLLLRSGVAVWTQGSRSPNPRRRRKSRWPKLRRQRACGWIYPHDE